jgi:hypothetical protein
VTRETPRAGFLPSGLRAFRASLHRSHPCPVRRSYSQRHQLDNLLNHRRLRTAGRHLVSRLVDRGGDRHARPGDADEERQILRARRGQWHHPPGLAPSQHACPARLDVAVGLQHRRPPPRLRRGRRTTPCSSRPSRRPHLVLSYPRTAMPWRMRKRARQQVFAISAPDAWTRITA